MLNAVKGKQENSQLNKKVLEKLFFFYKGRVQKTKNREKQQHKKNKKKHKPNEFMFIQCYYCLSVLMLHNKVLL